MKILATGLILGLLASCAAPQPGTKKYCNNQFWWCELNCPPGGEQKGPNTQCFDSCNVDLDACLLNVTEP